MDGSANDAQLMRAVFDEQKAAFSFAAVPSVGERKEKLQRLISLMRAYQDRIVHAVSEDYGFRAPSETRFSEVGTPIGFVADLKRHLDKWAGPKRFFKPLSTIPGRTYVRREPKGVVGIIAPWNYPFHLAIIPAATALAAGNRVMIKPSEFTPRTAALLAEMLAEGFPASEMAVVTGGPEIGEAFSSLPFDHLFYTGSTHIGRKVAMAAAANLTPVTLELGGKNPCLMMPDADPAKHAQLVAMGKWFNAGQTCAAPDYLLVPRGKSEIYAEALLDAARGFYEGDPAKSEDYSAIISDRHAARLDGLLSDAESRGARVLRLDADEDAMAAQRKRAPAVVLDPPEEANIMREEVFGPPLPIIEYDSLDEAVDYINKRDHPLSLYVFGDNVSACEEILDRTTSGGAAINATVLQLGVEHLPFGGIGASGQGAYHGEAGYRTFSHERGVLVFPQIDAIKKLMTPPYGKAWAFLTKRAVGKD